MAKTNRRTAPKAAAGRRNSRTTVSGPAEPASSSSSTDDLEAKYAGAEELASSMPHFAMPQAATAHDTFWDFASLMPEITAMLMWAMSDRAIPRSYRTMQGFGVHTFRFVNAAHESRFVKFHWSPTAGMSHFRELLQAMRGLRRRPAFLVIAVGSVA